MSVKLNSDNPIEALKSSAGPLAGSGLDWLERHRARGRERFGDVGLPTPRHEDWKYTDVRPITRHEYRLAGFGDAAPAPAVPTVEGLDAIRLVVLDGRVRPDLSALGDLPAGVRIGSLADAIERDPEAVRPWLGAALPAEGHGFSALNDAFVNDGVYLHVDDGVAVERPVEVVFMVGAADQAPLVQPRNLLVIGEQAHVNIIERYVCTGDAGPYLNNVITELFAGARSRVEFTRVQEEGERAGHVGGLFVRQRADSQCGLNTISLDGMVIRNDLRAFLDEPGAECRLRGLALGGGRQHIDNHTVVEHVVERCTSREFYKSVLDGRARSVFHGRIIVHVDAQKTDSEQQNENLLLSRDAEVDTKPQLEIYADDVKCSHGATVGQLDEDAVYYLRTRGMDEASARALLTVAFADAAIEGVSNDALRAHIDRRIRQKLDRDQ